MSEPNETPETQAAPENEQTAAVPAEAETEIVLTPEEAEAEIEEEQDPSEVKIFGMPRMCFHGAAFGVAAGYILTGLIGMAIEKVPGFSRIISKMPSATVLAIVCAVLGYLITKRQYNKRKAAREQEEEQSETK